MPSPTCPTPLASNSGTGDRQTSFHNTGDPTGPVTPFIPKGPSRKPLSTLSRLGRASVSTTYLSPSPSMVARSSRHVERSLLDQPQSNHRALDRCLRPRLGSRLRLLTHTRILEPRATSTIHQLPRAPSRMASSTVLPDLDSRPIDRSPHRQHDGSRSSFKDGPIKAHSFGPTNGQTLELLSIPSNSLESELCSFGSKSRRFLVSNLSRPQRLEVKSTLLSTSTTSMGTVHSRPICVPTKHSTSKVFQLAPRPSSRGRRCPPPAMGFNSGLCQPTMVTHFTDPSKNSTRSGHRGAHCTSMASRNLVPQPSSPIRGAPANFPSGSELVSPGPSRERVADPQPILARSRLETLRHTYQALGVSENAQKLLATAWAPTSAAAYESAWLRWVGWCQQQGVDSLRAPIAVLVNFLSKLFESGSAYRSLNLYRSAISSVHEPIDQRPVGQHPLVIRLLRGAFNLRAPQPKYQATWDMRVVVHHLQSWDPLPHLSLRLLTLKTVALLALAIFARPSDLIRIRRNSITFSNNQVHLVVALPKERSAKHPHRSVTLTRLTHGPETCPVNSLQAYLARTDPLIPKDCQGVFISYVKPYHPISLQRLRHWLLEILSRADIDTKKCSAHSYRAAGASDAYRQGVPMERILALANWSNATTFEQFYHRPSAPSEVVEPSAMLSISTVTS